MRKSLKIALFTGGGVLLGLALIVGVFWFLGRQGDPVEVTPVSYHTTYDYGSQLQLDGSVVADGLQSVYPSDTQTVTEVFVKVGQQVKKGDPLLSYDTTLSDIQLERQAIAVQQAELELQQAKAALVAINSMKPYSPPPTTAPTEPEPTEPLEPVEDLPYFLCGNGTQENPYRWLCAENMVLDVAFLAEKLGEKTEAWLAFEVRAENAVAGELLNRWGLHVFRETLEPTEEEGQVETGKLKFAFFAPEDAPSEDEPTEPEEPWVDDSSGYTASEIAQMRAEKEKEIRDLDLKKRMAQVEYDRMQEEVENGMIFAEVDGEVLQVTDAETSMLEGTPMLLISGGGCYYVKVALGEFDREKYPVGTPVTVISWENYGAEVAGVIERIDDTPVDGSSYYYYDGNPNVSRYYATVAVDAEASLREGGYVSVSFSGEHSADAGTFFLENMYLRKENGRSYVFKRGEDGTLEKCFVETGAGLWGSYTAVLSGLSEEDWIAFPYGKDVKQGAQTVESENGGFAYGY